MWPFTFLFFFVFEILDIYQSSHSQLTYPFPAFVYLRRHKLHLPVLFLLTVCSCSGTRYIYIYNSVAPDYSCSYFLMLITVAPDCPYSYFLTLITVAPDYSYSYFLMPITVAPDCPYSNFLMLITVAPDYSYSYFLMLITVTPDYSSSYFLILITVAPDCLSRPLLALRLGEYWFHISRYVSDCNRPLAPILRQSRCSLMYDVY
jgi:hypothetical protein